MKTEYLRKSLKIDHDYVIEKVEERGKELLVYCHSRKKGLWYEEVYSKTVSERRRRKIQHLMVEDQKVFLVITQRRFRFHKLKTCRWEGLVDIKRHSSTTNTFQLNTLRELQRDNYSGTGKKRGEVECFQ
jgi:hypothetical protein